MAFKNLTRQTMTLPRKGGGSVDIRAGETTTEAIDTEHAQTQGAILAGAIEEGAKRDLAPASTSEPAATGVRNRVKPD